MYARKMQGKSDKRMLSVEEAAAYIGLGFSKTKQLLSDINAKRSIGRRVVYDRKVIDRWLDSLAAGEED